MGSVPHILAVSDYSAFGRASLGVVPAVVSACGVQCTAVPCALYSAHLAVQQGEVAIADETAFLQGALAQYAALGLAFDALLTGFLPSVHHIEALQAYESEHPPKLRVVDPVLGDHGKLYRTATQELVQAVRRLCIGADLILPNETEAQILLGGPNQPIEAALAALQRMSGAAVVMTGATLPNGETVNAVLEKGGTPQLLPYRSTGVGYPGTGDLFAALVCAKLVSGKPLTAAVQAAADFVAKAAEATETAGTNSAHGLVFEPLLHTLYE